MADIKWIKLDTDLFNNRKIKQIKKLPEGKSILLIWINILCLAGAINDHGLVYFTKDIPYTDETLATEFDEELNIVKMAIKVFQQFQMIEVVDNFLMVSNWDKYQSVESMDRIRVQTRERVAKYRDKQKALLLDGNVTSNVTVTQRNAIDKELDKELDKDIYNVDLMFDTFWNNYPRKESKAKSKEWFKKNKPNRDLLDKMIVSLNKFKKTTQWQTKEFIPHATTWLNQKRWEDEVDLSSTSVNRYSKKTAPVPGWYEGYQSDLEKKNEEDKKNEKPMTQEEMDKLFNEVNEVL